MTTADRDLLQNLNWEHLRRHQVFTRGIMSIDEELIEGGKKKEFRTFVDLPPFSAVKITQAPTNFEEKKMPISSTEEQAINELVTHQPMDIKLQKLKESPEFDLSTPEGQQKAIESGRIQLVSKGTLTITKPLAIIVNPFAGKKRDVRPVIQQRLDMEKIPFEFIESTK